MKAGLIAQGGIQKFINIINDCSFSCKKRGETTATLKEKNAFPFTLCSCYNSESWILKAFSSCFCYYFINRFLLDRNSREKQYQEARNCFYCNCQSGCHDGWQAVLSQLCPSTLLCSFIAFPISATGKHGNAHTPNSNQEWSYCISSSFWGQRSRKK